jgi:PIN domain nuclease of toxin-antitoxin system
MTDYVVDTHALLWHLRDRARLGPGARTALDEVDGGRARVYIPAVVLAEMVMVAERRRVAGWTLAEVEQLVALVSDSRNYRFTSLTPELVYGSRHLTAIPDIFDRLVVTEALRLDVPLITGDSVIRQSGIVRVQWDATP